MRTLDPATEAGAHALERLETELAGWLTTINPDGQPQSSVVWFVWRDGEVLVYSHVRAPRNGNIEANPRVAFNLDTTADGDEYVTMEGRGPDRPDRSALVGERGVPGEVPPLDRPLRLDARMGRPRTTPSRSSSGRLAGGCPSLTRPARSRLDEGRDERRGPRRAVGLDRPVVDRRGRSPRRSPRR